MTRGDETEFDETVDVIVVGFWILTFNTVVVTSRGAPVPTTTAALRTLTLLRCGSMLLTHQLQ